jgi:Fe-S oxidoreductase
MEHHAPPKSTRVLMKAERAAKLGSAFAPFSNVVLNFPPARLIMEKVMGIDRRRKLPSFSHQTFAEKFALRKKSTTTKTSPLKVAFFHDLYANHNAPHLAESALRHLEALGAEVVVPEQRACGYPYIGYGDLDKAREVAEYNLSRFAPFVKDGYVVLSTEPTATYCFKDSYPVLLPESAEAKLVAGMTQEIFAYLLAHQPEPKTKPLSGQVFGFHCSCHQRPMGAGKEAVAWLERYGATMKRIETGSCCGMGGTFGLKHGPLGYDLSQAVGEPLFKLVRESGVEAIVTESSVCKMQLEEGTGLKVWHPLELIDGIGD